MTSEKLSDAVQLIKAGNKQAALPILKEFLQTNPQDENAWLWLYSCVEKVEQKKYCLRKALEINPGNQPARNALRKLTDLTPRPAPGRRLGDQRKKRPWLFALGVGLLLLLCGAPSLYLMQDDRVLPLAVSLLLAPSSTMTPSFTPTSTVTITPSQAPTLTPKVTRTVTPTATPTPRTAVSAGTRHTCWLKESGEIVCWGDNMYGQAIAPMGAFMQLSAGDTHSCAVKTDGRVACWGKTTSGLYGRVVVPPPRDTTFIQVSAGSLHSCGLKTDRTITCWGDNTYGQLGSPTETTFTQVSAGAFHTCGLKTDGTIACWGENLDGRASPPPGTFTQVSAGFFLTCGLKTDATIACWGANGAGQLDHIPQGTFSQISVGYNHTCAISAGGALACWGAGATTTGIRSEFGQAIPPGGVFTQVSAGYEHTCGLRVDTASGEDGTLICWGGNAYGQALPFVISGNAGVGGAVLSYTDGATKTAVSNADGTYAVAVSYNWSGTITVAYPGSTFVPAARTYTNLTASLTGEDYVALQDTPTPDALPTVTITPETPTATPLAP